MSFLDYKHNHFRNNVYKWRYAHDHITGDLLNELEGASARTLEEHFAQQDPGSSNSPIKQGKYLQRRLQGETDEAYKERQAIADYTPYLTQAIVALAGMAWSNDRDKVVTWEESELGSPTDPDSIMYKLWDNADGKGANWDSLHKLATVDLIAGKEIWSLVSGVKRGKDGEAINAGSINFVLPQDVPDWVEDDDHNLSEVKACYEADMRRSITEKPSITEIFQVFEAGGWTRYSKDKNSKVKELDRGFYGGKNNQGFRFYTTNDRNTWQERLPIFKKALPIRANIGYMGARKCNSIYNMENARDFQLWATCFPKAFLDVLHEDGTLNKELYDEIKQAIRSGSNVWPGSGHKFDTPPVSGAEIRNATIELKQRQFMKMFFQMAGDQAKEKTATQIKVDFKAGVEAFLGYVVTTLDEIENEELFLLEQIHFPGEPAKWGKTKVKRSDDFSHIDLDAEIDRAVNRWVPGGRLPATEDMILDLTKRGAERDRLSLPEDDEELKALIRQQRDQQTQSDDVFSQIRSRRRAA